MVSAVERNIPAGAYDHRYRIGTLVGLAAIVMMFTALTSAYIVRAASASDFGPIAMPRILLLSTTLIVLSSGTLEVARHKLKARLTKAYQWWLSVTVILGAGFLVSQILAWQKLVENGIYVATNAHSSFFYLLTVTHGVHLLGGLLALLYLLFRRADSKRLAKADAVSIYWHVMDALWIYLFLLLFLWR